MQVLKFLNVFDCYQDALVELESQYGIKAKVTEYGEDALVLLDYDQINSPKCHPFTIECRSLILGWTEQSKFFAVSRKFDRGFNLGEALDFFVDFDLENADVYEKADGSLIGIYRNPFTLQYEVSTRGMMFANGEHVLGGTFREKVLSSFGFASEYEFQKYFVEVSPLTTGETHIFEYIGPENRVVTPYKKSEMVLLGVRFANTGVELPKHFLDAWVLSYQQQGLNVRSVESYGKAISQEKILEFVETLPDLKEGFILHDSNSGKRMKVKSSVYVMAHKLRGNNTVPTRKNLLEMMFTGDEDEFLAYFPEYTELVVGLRNEIETFIGNMETIYEKTKDIESQKDFALAIKGVEGTPFLFSARKDKKSIREVFTSAGESVKLKFLKAE